MTDDPARLISVHNPDWRTGMGSSLACGPGGRAR